jgi:hypothetical protein
VTPEPSASLISLLEGWKATIEMRRSSNSWVIVSRTWTVASTPGARNGLVNLRSRSPKVVGLWIVEVNDGSADNRTSAR